MNDKNDINDIMKHHLGNISRQVGHDVSNRYSYIVSQNDLINAYTQMRDELGYPLMIDSKYRRAIVMNKKGLEEKIDNMIMDVLCNNINELIQIVSNDTVDNIANQINSLIQTSNGLVAIGNRSNTRSSSLDRFARMLGRAMVKGFTKIVEDMCKSEDSI